MISFTHKGARITIESPYGYGAEFKIMDNIQNQDAMLQDIVEISDEYRRTKETYDELETECKYLMDKLNKKEG